MAERTTVGQAEAQFMRRLIQAWTAAQDVVHHLGPIMQEMGLLKANGSLNTERILLIEKKAKQE